MSANTVYVISGANRGIGRGIVAILLQRPSTTVLALVRDPAGETSASLSSLPKAANSAIHVLPLDESVGSENGPNSGSLVTLAAAHGVTHADVVIANAGASSGYKSVLETTPSDLLYDYGINTVGPLRLIQAAWPLLAEGKDKKFVLITSSVGSIAGQAEESFPSTAYGMSKAAANWLLVKIGVELGKQGLSVMALHPGWVKTPMGQGIADSIGFPEPPMTVEASASACVARIDELDAGSSGRFVSHDGQVLPW